uniref:cubilin-like n=1 Tax=Ciona intestinalis TaxID=7719 RepID=UPI000EF45670|nr:cubilin-like [Ciona intestinalis]|eukprot:XP_026695900.1 cubilin-like [Ciona intestinalis]
MKSIVFILFLAVYSGCSDDDDVIVDSRVSTEQSRMYTNNGHLFFEAGGGFNISFKTKQGRVNINDKDLDVVTTQVTQNQLDITDIKQNGGMSPGAVNQIDNNTKLIGELKQSLEEQQQTMTKLETTVGDLVATVQAMEEVSLKDDCSSNPCRNGASCVDFSFICS